MTSVMPISGPVVVQPASAGGTPLFMRLPQRLSRAEARSQFQKKHRIGMTEVMPCYKAPMVVLFSSLFSRAEKPLILLIPSERSESRA